MPHNELLNIEIQVHRGCSEWDLHSYCVQYCTALTAYNCTPVYILNKTRVHNSHSRPTSNNCRKYNVNVRITSPLHGFSLPWNATHTQDLLLKQSGQKNGLLPSTCAIKLK